MKKLFTILLAAGMLSMYSCGSGSDQTGGTGDSTAVAPATETPAAEPAPAPADTAAMSADTTAH